MTLRSRLVKLERIAAPTRQHGSVIQIVQADGTARPTDEEAERQFAEWRTEGVEPGLVRITIVEGPNST